VSSNIRKLNYRRVFRSIVTNFVKFIYLLLQNGKYFRIRDRNACPVWIKANTKMWDYDIGNNVVPAYMAMHFIQSTMKKDPTLQYAKRGAMTNTQQLTCGAIVTNRPIYQNEEILLNLEPLDYFVFMNKENSTGCWHPISGVNRGRNRG